MPTKNDTITRSFEIGLEPHHTLDWIIEWID